MGQYYYEFLPERNGDIDYPPEEFYELLYVTKIFDKIEGKLKCFHICEALVTFIMSIVYYLEKWNSKLKL